MQAFVQVGFAFEREGGPPNSAFRQSMVIWKVDAGRISVPQAVGSAAAVYVLVLACYRICATVGTGLLWLRTLLEFMLLYR